MSMEILYELDRDVRRLMIAGSAVAAGDMNLRRQLPPLIKLGEASPVFKRLAQVVQELLEAGRDEGAAKLLELGTLLNSVLYTQGRTEAAGELAPLPGTDIQASTAVPYRKLAPALEALTTKGQGRLETLRQAHEAGCLKDLRVLPAAVAALGDSYPDVAEFVQQAVLPVYGSDALPVLRAQLNLNGGRGDARRLELMLGLIGSEGLELYLEAAREGSPEVRAAAIELLGHYPEQESFVLELAEEKRKDLRRAAFDALARLDTTRARERLLRALDGKDRELAVEPLRRMRSEEVKRGVLRHAEAAWEQLLSGVQREEAVASLHIDLVCLQGWDTPGLLELLRRVIAAPEFLAPDTERLQEEAIRLLLAMEAPEAGLFALELQQLHQGRFIGASLEAAVRILPAEQVYDRFAPEFKTKRSAKTKELLRVMKERIPDIDSQLEASEEEGEWILEWDSRWVPLLIDIDDEDLVARLVRRPDRKAVDYLIRKVRESKDFQKWGTVESLLALFRLGAKEAPELLMDTLEHKGGRPYYYMDRMRLALLGMLPAVYADRLRAYGETLAYPSLKMQVLEIAESLPEKQPAVENESEEGTGIWAWLKNKMS
ncbi:HEAT repeat domain-containing protein [Gorillibacterium sp. sgz5001074]|uniref:HEAT repeat domain-containing protein n=1 Tax=Gorillibacterium sp. sgz5001074 TaxID=3446695 RepID=UPI003F66FB5D